MYVNAWLGVGVFLMIKVLIENISLNTFEIGNYCWLLVADCWRWQAYLFDIIHAEFVFADFGLDLVRSKTSVYSTR